MRRYPPTAQSYLLLHIFLFHFSEDRKLITISLPFPLYHRSTSKKLVEAPIIQPIIMFRFTVSGLCLLAIITPVVTTSARTYDHCIVGAGPGGIQLAKFLKDDAHSDYVVLERNDIAGSFFTECPKHEMLISINKKNTGQENREFNLRHDWNSLLTDQFNNGTDFLFSDFTEDYWPHRSYMVQYLNAFVDEYKINIMYQTSIQTVTKDADSGIFTLYTKNGEDSNVEYQCQTVIWAAGLSKPRIFENTLITPYHDVLPASHYKNKSVAIVGSGQAAFELARDIYKVSASTMIFYRSAPKFAYNTHYVGDLRAINHEIVDSYQLKSLGTYEQL
jgi:cation diffusion facilitator CzcD-associated flavoprotein CzcO